MEYDVVWLDEAKDDIRQFLAYLSSQNPEAARKYGAEIVEAGDGLRQFPRRGRVYNRRFRVSVTRNHLLFYAVDDDSQTVEVHRVLDGRRNVPGLLEEDEPFSGDRTR